MRPFIEALESRQLLSGNLIVNGSFETPVVSGFKDYTAGQLAGSGWKVSSGSVDVISSAGGHVYSTAAASGAQSADMNGTSPGTITQTVATTLGDTYVLKFAYTATPFATDGKSPNTRKMNVLFGGKTIATLSKNEAGETPGKPGWTYVSYTVTAGSASSAITFVAGTAGTLGMMLDNVSLVATAPNSNLLVNGDFEATAVNGFKDYTAGQLTGSGWKVSSGSVDVISKSGGHVYSTTPASGAQSLDLNGMGPGTIMQTVATTAGDTYVIKFAYTATPFATDKSSPNTRKMTVSFGGKTVATLGKSETGETPAKPGWTYVSYTVTATSASSILTFMSNTPGTLGMMLDDVSLVS